MDIDFAKVIKAVLEFALNVVKKFTSEDSEASEVLRYLNKLVETVEGAITTTE